MTAAGLIHNPELAPWEEARIVDHLIAAGRAPNLGPMP